MQQHQFLSDHLLDQSRISLVIEPRYPKRKTPSKLDDYELTLTSWLFRETRRHRKYRRSVKQLSRNLVDLGFTGSYDRVAAFARLWRESQKEALRNAGKKHLCAITVRTGRGLPV
jgi:hypothetical protein